MLYMGRLTGDALLSILRQTSPAATGLRPRNCRGAWVAEIRLSLKATLTFSDANDPKRPDLVASGSAATFGGALVAASQPSADTRASDIHHALRELHVLLRSARLYGKDHPRLLDSLDAAYESLRSLAGTMNGLELRIERGGIIVPKLHEAHVPDARGELHLLATDLQRAGVQTLVFAQKFHVGELDTLAQLLKLALLRSEEPQNRSSSSWWPAHLLGSGVEGILVNAKTERRVDTVLASLIAALVAYGGNSPQEHSELPLRPPDADDLSATLHLLARLTPPLEGARGLSPQEAARAIHKAMEEASHDTVRMLLSAVSQHGPRDAEGPQAYLLRLSEVLTLEFLSAELSAGALPAPLLAAMVNRFAAVLVSSGGYSGPHASQHLSSLATAWASDKHREKLIERFWLELAPRERSAVLRAPESWCVPIPALKRTLTLLAEAGADAPRREARNILLNYVRRLDLASPDARRAVAAGCNELTELLESLWPNQFPEDLPLCALRALEKETIPEVAALLAAFLETLARVAVTRADYAGFENILLGLERAPEGAQSEPMEALAHRLVSQDRWLLLIDAALANRALEPVLPRLLQRDPERLLDRLTLLLTEPRSAELLPAMARLLRTIGVPVLNLLETRLYEARKQRVSAAIKLLAVTDPERLLRGLSRAMGSWEWNLQDLAVSELARPSNSASAQSAAFVFAAVLADAHPLVVPMMIDHIGLAQETTAVPQLMEIAAGEHEVLRDLFTRIKAVEALGRMRALEASDLLCAIAERREGLAYAEPSGLRAAAADALAMFEEGPASTRARAAYESAAHAAGGYVVPRRYVRVPLESPLRAQIEGSQAGLARVKTISLGGAYLELPHQLSVGDSIQLEVRSGLRKMNFTAVVRNSAASGSGVEFVHMKGGDRDKLRKLVRRHLKV
jgi:hypothetical protein